MKNNLVIFGGSKGLGAGILKLIHKEYNNVFLFDVISPLEKYENVNFSYFDLSKDDIRELTSCIENADDLIFTAGVGSLGLFSELSIVDIEKIFNINTISFIKILRIFNSNLIKKPNSSCLVTSSIAAEVSSPLFSVYGASKASISKICESLNVELEKANSKNRITCITATSFEGTSFYGKETDLLKIEKIASECITAMKNKECSHFINKELCLDIIKRYNEDRQKFGESSYDYKVKSDRMGSKKKNVIGYLSGTFDLFHIGHLNLLKRAKKECDYLIVGVHKSGSWKGKETFIPFEERLEIIKSIKYVDEVCESPTEDSDAWNLYYFDKLFVGDDYKNSERFNRYEEYFKQKGVEIVYFPYTKTTSSSQIREIIKKSR